MFSQNNDFTLDWYLYVRLLIVTQIKYITIYNFYK